MGSRQQLNIYVQQSQDYFDLTQNTHQDRLLQLADNLCKLTDITQTELQEIADKQGTPLEFRLAVKLVKSRQQMQAIEQRIQVAVVFAMWGEHNRLFEKSVANPNGEDSLRMKIKQLNWVTQGTSVHWHLYPVDDGCPHNSAGIAESILLSHPERAKVTVLRLSDALPTADGPLQHLASVDDSRKGGAIICGCMQALDDGCDCVVYTDADNSVHLGQLGLLVAPFANKQQAVVLGNRKHPQSILVKQEERWGVGIKTLRHMQRMIGREIFDGGIKDTQAAFKLYSRQAVAQIISAPAVYDFSFDTDWLLAVMELDLPLCTVPFAFIDSAAESASITQGPMTTWYTLIHGLVTAARVRHADHNAEMADVFELCFHSHKDLELIIDKLPEQLRDVNDAQLGDPQVMSPQEIKAWFLQTTEVGVMR